MIEPGALPSPPTGAALLVIDMQVGLFGAGHAPARRCGRRRADQRPREGGPPGRGPSSSSSTTDLRVTCSSPGARVEDPPVAGAGGRRPGGAQARLRRILPDGPGGSAGQAPRDGGLLVTGCATDFCVDTTVRVAASRDYEIVVVADGHTTADRAARGRAVRHPAPQLGLAEPDPPTKADRGDAGDSRHRRHGQGCPRLTSRIDAREVSSGIALSRRGEREHATAQGLPRQSAPTASRSCGSGRRGRRR